MKENVKDNIILTILVLFLISLISSIFVFEFNENVEKTIIDVEYTDDIEKDLSLFLDNYYDNMNKYGVEHTEKFVSDFFTEEYIEDMDLGLVSNKLKLYKKIHGESLLFEGELLGTEHDDLGYYLGVSESIKANGKSVEDYNGIYILEKIDNEYKIAYITGFFDNESVNIIVD